MRGADMDSIRDSGRPGLRGVTPVTWGTRVTALGVMGLVAVQLHVLAQGARVGVALVAAPHLAHVGFVAGVHVRMFLSVAAVRKPPVAALELTFKRFLT